MNMSEKVMTPLVRGMGMWKRETTSSTATSGTSRKSRRASGRFAAPERTHQRPGTTHAHMYGLTSRCLFMRRPPRLALQEDRVVVAAQLVAGLHEERLRDEVLLVDERADRGAAPQKLPAEVRKTAQPVPLLPARRLDVDALDVGALRRLRGHVGLEDEPARLDHDPHPPRPDAAGGAQAEAVRVYFERVDAALVEGHRGVDGHDEREVVERGAAQGRDRLAGGDGPALLEEKLAAEQTRPLPFGRVVLPEAAHESLLAEDHVRVRLLLRQPGEGGERRFGARLDEGGVADERDAFEASR